MESNVKINLNDVILCYVEGGDEIKAKNFFDLITFVVNLNLKTLYKILIEIKSNAIHYKIDKSEIVDSCKKLPFFGIKGDFMFKEFKTGIFREDHFLDVIKSLNIYWKNNNLNPVKQRIILDIGANIGSHSIVLAKFFPSH